MPFDIDGIVIKLNKVKLWDTLGTTAKSPRWATAFKFKAEQAESRLLTIEYQVGRTGIITPVAVFEPVWLGGTWVKRASVHNAEQMQRLDLCQGDIVIIEKGGEIIPKIVGKKQREIESDKSATPCKKIDFISHCPVCGAKLVRQEGEAGHYCPNYNHCPPQIFGRFQHFVSKKAMNIETLGDEKIKAMLDQGLLKDFSSLYDLTASDLVGLTSGEEGSKSTIRAKGAANMINAIEKSKQAGFERVLYALGIRYVGEVTAKKLARYYKNIDALKAASFNQLVEIDEIGESIAESLVNYFANSENTALIDRLRARGLKFELQEEEMSSTLEGLSFVISGTFTLFSRDELKKQIEKHSGRVISSISSKVDYVICGENMGPQKKKKAEDLGIKMIDQYEFAKMIDPEKASDK